MFVERYIDARGCSSGHLFSKLKKRYIKQGYYTKAGSKRTRYKENLFLFFFFWKEIKKIKKMGRYIFIGHYYGLFRRTKLRTLLLAFPLLHDENQYICPGVSIPN
ncbi:MAG: hypothetical protein GY866_21055 [Proteobacteria bacterium]|nr:hypothetical protein [Pseudomonadota bacterium]